MILSYRRQHTPGAARLVGLAACLGVLVLAAAANAQIKPAPAPAPTSAAEVPADQPAEDTPRSTVQRFLELARGGRYADAAKYLELPAADSTRGPQLAGRLKAVLDRHIWVDLAALSAAAGGDPDDGLPQGVDEITKIPVAGGLSEPVRLVRRGPADARWVFSRVTIQRVDGWYEVLPHRWLLELAPEPLLRMGPGSMLWAQWAALPAFLLLIWTAGIALSRATRRVLIPLVKRTNTQWDDALLDRLSKPLHLGWMLALAHTVTPWLGLYEPALLFAQRLMRALLFATFFWALSRSVDVAGQVFAQSQWGHGAPGTRALLLFGSRVGKLFVAALALVALFSELGYPVTSLIAGLGVGGIAVALAAQKSLENLIGAFAIAVDQPFREGDLVRIGDLLGHVEAIGIRSTRVRTPERTLVSIPNGKLAEMRLETFAARDRIRWAFTFGLTYSTSEVQTRSVVTGIERLLRDHPKIWADDIAVRLKEFGESALIIEVGTWFRTKDFDEFAGIRQEMLLQFMALVERVGAHLAFPTHSIEIVDRTVERKPDSGAMRRPEHDH